MAYSITSSARANSAAGTLRPSAIAVLRLITSSNFAGCSIGRSPGVAPLSTLTTRSVRCPVARCSCSSGPVKIPRFCGRLKAMTNKNASLTQWRFDVPASDIACLLHPHPLFAETDLVALKQLLGRGRILALRAGDLLLCQGEASDAAYILIEGSASIRIETNYGRVNLSTVSAPTLVGEIGIFTGVPRTATIEATTPLRVLRIDSRDLQEFGSENPRFLAAVMMQVGRRFQIFNQAVGLYSNALEALRQHDLDLRLLDDLQT